MINHMKKKILVGLMIDQVKKANRPTTTFSNKACSEIVNKFYKRKKYKKQQFKNKFNKMRMALGSSRNFMTFQQVLAENAI